MKAARIAISWRSQAVDYQCVATYRQITHLPAALQERRPRATIRAFDSPSRNQPTMKDTKLDVLVVAPHPDDAEIGMAGTILKLQAEGAMVGVLDLTSGEPTPLGSPEIRRQETVAATELLGLGWRENLGLSNRSLEPTLEARAQLAGVFRQTRPRWIFAPYWIDAHPDHVAAAQLIEAARFWSKLTKTDLPGEPFYPERIYHYFSVHLRLTPQPAFVVDISEHWDRKRAVIECYRSQFIAGRPEQPPTFVDRLRDQAATWGWSIGARYGEPFASREPIGLRGLKSLM
jgi:N-acetylglucosamine malate deacetylase 1